MKRIINAIKKYLIKDTRYFLRYSVRQFQSSYANNANFISEEELSSKIKEGKSFMRIGDGEIGLIHFNQICYQRYSDEIRLELIEMISKYSNNLNYILGIPIFLNMTNRYIIDNLPKDRLRCWMPLKVTFELLFNKNATYADAHIFYRDGRFEKIILPYIKTKKVILVSNIENLKNAKKTDLNKIVVSYLECVSENSFEERFKIKDKIINEIKVLGGNISDYVILMQVGLAKLIIPEMSEDGYQLLDIGKGAEGYYNNESLESLI